MNELKVTLLVGGMGTRLGSVVSSQPKGFASIGGRPFLEIVIGTGSLTSAGGRLYEKSAKTGANQQPGTDAMLPSISYSSRA